MQNERIFEAGKIMEADPPVIDILSELVPIWFCSSKFSISAVQRSDMPYSLPIFHEQLFFLYPSTVESG